MNRNRRIHGRIAGTGERLGVGWPVRPCKGSALAVGLAGLIVATLTVGTSGKLFPPTAINSIRGPIHGTITGVDTPRLYLSLYADDGRRVVLTSANVDAMRALHAGDHVRVDLDGQGIALNINKTVSTPHPVSYSRG